MAKCLSSDGVASSRSEGATPSTLTWNQILQFLREMKKLQESKGSAAWSASSSPQSEPVLRKRAPRPGRP